jgi:hypothetical protein
LSKPSKEKTPQATNSTRSKEIVVEAPQVVKHTLIKEMMSSNVVNKAPQAFKGKEKATQKSNGGSPRRKLVIHGLVMTSNQIKRRKNCPSSQRNH